MYIEFRKRNSQEIKGRLFTKEWEVSSLLGFIGFSILLVAILISAECVHELAYCNPDRLDHTYQVIDTIEMKDSFRGYSHIHITTKNGNVYHLPDYVLKNSIEEEFEEVRVAADQFVRIQYYDPWFSTDEIRGLSTGRTIVDANESCELSRAHSLQLLSGAVVGICASAIILLLAMGIVQIKSRSGRTYIQ